MFWLIWQMGVLLVIFSGLGLLVGYLVWSGDARSIDADKAQADNARLRQENENLARRLGEASADAAEVPAKSETVSGEDDLTRIKGLGPKAEAALKAGGVTTFAQIAAWSDTDVEVWDDRINGRGRIERDSWVSQARDLAG
jgi:predicted flap endonuclease-1-like 5' DNA nuclease